MRRTRHILMVALILVLLSASLFAGGKAEQVKAEETGPAKILWWSHWANEPAKVKVIETIKSDYMAAHPDVEIELVWWDKNPLQDAWRTSMTAKTGAPDIVTDPADKVVEQLKAGWFLELGDDFPWQNFYPEVKTIGNRFEGVEGEYLFHISRTLQMLFYNKDIFREIGVTVPDDYTFTIEEFVDIVKKASAKGYAGVANAVGNRPYPATFLTEYLLLDKVGSDEFELYRTGRKSWSTPEAREVLEYGAKLRDAGFWPPSFASMSIDEFHVYFHTQRKAAMLMIPTWYPGRAFKPVSDGGQDPNFRFGMLRYPKFPGGVAHDKVIGSYESGYIISAASRRPDVALDILAFATKPRYGALWELYDRQPVGDQVRERAIFPRTFRRRSELVPRGNRAKGVRAAADGDARACLPAPPERTGDFMNATTTALNQGLPMKLISVDEAVKQVNAAVKK